MVSCIRVGSGVERHCSLKKTKNQRFGLLWLNASATTRVISRRWLWWWWNVTSHWWRKLEHPEESTNRHQVTDKTFTHTAHAQFQYRKRWQPKWSTVSWGNALTNSSTVYRKTPHCVIHGSCHTGIWCRSRFSPYSSEPVRNEEDLSKAGMHMLGRVIKAVIHRDLVHPPDLYPKSVPIPPIVRLKGRASVPAALRSTRLTMLTRTLYNINVQL